MREKIKQELQRYLQQNYPEVILLFTERGTLEQYLDDRITLIDPLTDELLEQGKTDQEIIEHTISAITASFGPSRYLYLKEIMEQEFIEEYTEFEKRGVLKFELTNLILACSNAFDAFDFSKENLDDHFLRHMVIAEIHDYLISRSQN